MDSGMDGWDSPAYEGLPEGFDVRNIEQFCGRIETAPEGASTPAEGLTNASLARSERGYL